MKQLLIFMLACGLFGLSSCDKCHNKDCTNGTCENGTCHYLADDYVGVYTVTDSTFSTVGGNTTFHSARSYGFSTKFKAYNEITLISFGGCTDTITATVSSSNFVISDPNSQCDMGFSNGSTNGLVVTKNGSTLTYTAIIHMGVTTYTVYGRANKQ